MVRTSTLRRQGKSISFAAASAVALLLAGAAQAGLTHRYSFNTDGQAEDSVGGAAWTGTLVNGASVSGGRLILGNPGNSSDAATGQYVDLPNNIAQTADVTVEFWTTWGGPVGWTWQRFFDFGNSTIGEVAPGNLSGFGGAEWFYLSPRKGAGVMGSETKNSGPDVWGWADSNFEFSTGVEHHLALVFSSAEQRMRVYQDGVEVGYNAAATGLPYNPSAIDMLNCWIGRSNFSGDAFYAGSFDEFRIYDTALSAAAISASYTLGPNPSTATWAVTSGDWSDGNNWAPNIVPSTLAIIDNGGTSNVTTFVSPVTQARLVNGVLNINAGGTLIAGMSLIPGNLTNTVSLQITGGNLTTNGLVIDPTGPAANKSILINGGTLVATASFTVGPEATTTVGASGATIEVYSGATLTWQPPLTPSGATSTLNKVGSGALLLTAGGYAAPVNVRAGTLAVAGDVGIAAAPLQLGDGAVSGGYDASLRITAPATIVSPITVGTDNVLGTYSLEVAGDNAVSVPQPITLNGPLTLRNAATTGANALNLKQINSASITSNTLTFDNAGLVVVDNGVANGITDAAAGTLSIVKNGAGEARLLSPSTYTGATTINNGMLFFAAPSSIGGTGASVTVADGAVAGLGTAFNYADLTNTVLARVTSFSQGVVALSSNSAENFDLTLATMPSQIFLGAIGNVSYSGTITPGAGAYRLGGGPGVLTVAGGANKLTGFNSLIVGGSNGSTVVLAAANDYAGGTLIQKNSTLSISNADQVGSGAITFNNGALRVTGTTPVTIAPVSTVTGGIGIDVTDPAGSLTFTGGFSGTAGGALDKYGPGTFAMSGPTATLTNYDLGGKPFLMHNGTTVLGESAIVSTTGWTSIGVNTSENAALVLRDSAQLNASGDFNVSDLADSRGSLIIRDNAILTTSTVYVGKNATTQGAVRQTGGQFNGIAGGGEWRIGGSFGTGDAQSVGTYTMTGGTLTTPVSLQVGAWGRGAMEIQGGEVSSGGYPSAGRFPGSYGTINVQGTGKLTQSNAATLLIIGEEGAGTLNVQSGGTVNAAGNVSVGHAAAGAGIVNLHTGGVLSTPRVTGSAGQSQLNFHGGAVKATTAGTLITNLKAAYVWTGGAVIDTNGFDVTVNQALLQPIGNGVTDIPVATGGAGYIAHPVVEISGGGGTGASGVAVLNAAGEVTGIQITNPGVGYTSAPTVAIKGGGSTTPATLGIVAIGANGGNGGLTKVGAGVLTLTQPSTYAGPTVISAGTLRLAAPVNSAAVWEANSLAGADGQAVTNWADTIAARAATPYNGIAPTLVNNAINGNKAVHFEGGSSQGLVVAGTDSPIGGIADYTIAVVFRTSTNGAGADAQWWSNTGLVDAEQGGATADWGIAFNSGGKVGAGFGNPDRTAYSQGGLADGNAHVAIITKSGTDLTVNVDGVVNTIGGAATTNRNVNPITFGLIATGANFFTGDIAEIRMFQAPLGPVDVNRLGNDLASRYGAAAAYGPTEILPAASPVSIAAGAALDLNSRNSVVGSLAGEASSQVLLGNGTLVTGYNHTDTTFAGDISGTGGITKIGGGAWTLSGTNTYSGDTRVNGGVLRLATVSSLPGGTGRVIVNEGTLAQTGGADPAATLAAVVNEVKLSRNGGSWDGAGRYSSESARGAYLFGLPIYGLGVILNNDGSGNPVRPEISAAITDVLVRYTFNGDADLDGVVGPDDYFQADAGFLSQGTATPKTGWYNGDFNYDGRIDIDDYFLIDTAYALTPAAPASTGGPAAVPEPATISLLALGAAGLLGRRRRA